MVNGTVCGQNVRHILRIFYELFTLMASKHISTCLSKISRFTYFLEDDVILTVNFNVL